MNKLKKNDKVKVISGKDAGREGLVEKIFTHESLVLVKDINQVTKHQKKSAGRATGGIIKISKPIAVANVMLICSKCNKPTRIGIKLIDGKKSRACKKCGELV